MEAALWGRVQNVKTLLRYDADKALNDRQGCNSFDLETVNSRNK